ncbi:MAG: protoheme IX farnesyltransferase [Armatimonadetes bacterium]|nr:protoheme IX farnesyltransferase [Armatimonadota bacterium]
MSDTGVSHRRGESQTALHQGAKTAPELVRPSFAKAAWWLLAYCCAAILFGAFVRASYSGDGCGTSWPMCGGSLIPTFTGAPRAVEFTHRVTTGLLMLANIALAVAARRAFPRGDAARKAANLALITVLISAVIGALLVTFQWVTDDKSAGRALTMPIHLVNNFIAIAALAATAYYAGTGRRFAWRGQGAVSAALAWAFGAMFLLGATGAFSALGKTAFEHELSFAKSFAERMWLHVGPEAHPLLRGGVAHPLIATSVGILLIYVCGLIAHARPSAQVKAWARWTVGLYIVQMVLGAVNLTASAPVALQIVHLAVALGNWLTLVMLALTALGTEARAERAEDAAPAEDAPSPQPAFVASVSRRATWKDYVALTKPRVISLLLFTTVAAMFVGHHGAPPLWLLVAVCVGGYASAGAANAFNMVIEMDLDRSMARTSHRPTVRDAVTKRQALTFAWILAVGSFALLTWAANLLTAVMALSGLLCYVFVYTLWLKRRTWQNIVIGGAAGAFPPLVGYASVTGTLSPFAWYLFAVVFLWTPVHFWALALLIKDDYAKAGVPMLPVVKGDKVTVHQIGLYTVLTSLVSVMPFFQGQAGPLYLVGSVVLNLGLIVQTARLWQRQDKPQARALFKFSMAYLALFFIVAAVDQARWM